jgi:hypothetical protein
VIWLSFAAREKLRRVTTSQNTFIERNFMSISFNLIKSTVESQAGHKFLVVPLFARHTARITQTARFVYSQCRCCCALGHLV